MATCIKCGAKLGLFNKSDKEGVCINCVRREYVEKKEKRSKQENERFRQSAEAEEAVQDQIANDIRSILLTTETVPSLRIVERIEIVTAEVAFGQNVFKDLFAGVRDIVGGRSEAIQKTMRDARRAALYELKKEAYEVGANAVVAVDLDYVELSSTGSMVMLVASGTAVKIEG